MLGAGVADVDLPALEPSRTYSYMVSIDIDGDASSYGPFEFTVGADTAPPVGELSGLAVERVGSECDPSSPELGSCVELMYRQACDDQGPFFVFRVDHEESEQAILYEVRNTTTGLAHALPAGCELVVYDSPNDYDECGERYCYEVTVYDGRGLPASSKTVWEQEAEAGPGTGGGADSSGGADAGASTTGESPSETSTSGGADTPHADETTRAPSCRVADRSSPLFLFALTVLGAIGFRSRRPR